MGPSRFLAACACVALLSAPARADLRIVNATGQNLPELPIQVDIALGGLFERVPAPVVLTLDLVETTDLRDRNIQPFPFGPRFVQPRGYVNDWATTMVQGRIAVTRRIGSVPVERRFIGRAAAWQDYEPTFAALRARRPHAGFIEGPARRDPNGPLVAAALANAFAKDHLAEWVLSVPCAPAP